VKVHEEKNMEATDSTTTTGAAATIGDFIRQRRTALEMTQSELSRKIGKHQVWVSQLERGHSPVRSEEVPDLAEALQVDSAELRSMLGIHEVPVEPEVTVNSPIGGVVTKEVVTTEVLRWQVGDSSVPVEELSRENLLGAVRSLFEINGRLRAEFEKEMGEMAEAYEQKIHSLHLVLAAQVELDIREAVRDKMEVILEAVMAEVERHQSSPPNDHTKIGNSKKETTDGH
jgi:transcriptional regulator with XRE-family HTH domain